MIFQKTADYKMSSKLFLNFNLEDSYYESLNLI